MPVEAGGVSDHTLHVLRCERLEERLQLLVRQPREETAHPARDLQVGTEASPPAVLIGAEVADREPIAPQCPRQRLGRQEALEQAIEYAATRRRFGQARGIAHREDAMAVAPPGRCQG